MRLAEEHRRQQPDENVERQQRQDRFEDLFAAGDELPFGNARLCQMLEMVGVDDGGFEELLELQVEKPALFFNEFDFLKLP